MLVQNMFSNISNIYLVFQVVKSYTWLVKLAEENLDQNIIQFSDK